MLVLSWAFVACTNSDDTCRENKYVRLQIKLYRDTLNKKTLLRDTFTFSIDSITVKGVGSDSLLYNNQKLISTLQLPLNPAKKEVKYILLLNNIEDTLTIKYNYSDEYLSLECGVLRTFDITTAESTHHYSHSLILSQSKVSTINAENIRIYRSK